MLLIPVLDRNGSGLASSRWSFTFDKLGYRPPHIDVGDGITGVCYFMLGLLILLMLIVFMCVWSKLVDSETVRPSRNACINNQD